MNVNVTLANVLARTYVCICMYIYVCLCIYLSYPVCLVGTLFSFFKIYDNPI